MKEVSKLKFKLNKNRLKNTSMSFFRIFFLLSFGYVVLYPLLYMISRAIIAPGDAIDPTIVWVPNDFSAKNFEIAYKAMEYGETVIRTLSIQVLSGCLEVFTCAVVAYGFARFDIPGKNLLFMLVLITMIVPSQAIIVPLYLNYNKLDFLGILGLLNKMGAPDLRINILNTGWTFYLPSLFALGLKSGLFIFIYRQFFKSFPKELEEAASIDGAGPIRVLLYILFPSSGVAFLCVFVFSLIAHWNDYYLSVMFFSDKYPLSVRLSEIETHIQYGGFSDIALTTEARSNVAITACLLFLAPILILYLFLQRKFIESVESVGIVG